MVAAVLNSMSVGQRLALVQLVPLLFAGYLSIDMIAQEIHQRNNMHRLGLTTEFFRVTSAVVHELQKERGRTAGYYGNPSPPLKRGLDAQRLIVDEHIEQLQTYVTHQDPADQVFAEYFEVLRSQLETIGTLRESVNRRAINDASAIARYNRLINHILGQVAESSHFSEDAELALDISALSKFQQIKDIAGLERATLYKAFATDSLSTAEKEDYLSLVASQNTLLKSFFEEAPARAEEQLQDMMRSSAFAEVERMRDIVDYRSSAGSFGVDPDHWFTVATRKIDLMNTFELELNQYINDLVEHEKTQAMGSLYKYVALMGLCIVLSLTLSMIVSTGLRGPLSAAPSA